MKHERVAAAVPGPEAAVGERSATSRDDDSHGSERGAAPATRTEGDRAGFDARDVDWRSQLAGASPREVLARLIAKDSLGLRARVAAALAEHAYLLDADRVWLRAVARVARFSTRYRGEPALDRWLRSQIDDAIGDCLESAPRRAAADHGASSSFDSLARPLGLDPNHMQAVCAAVNACSASERAAFFALVLDREDLDRAALRLGVTPTEGARAARRALEACMRAAMQEDDAQATAREVGS